MLASNGAKRFAELHGFAAVPVSQLLAPETLEFYEKWKRNNNRGKALNEGDGKGNIKNKSKKFEAFKIQGNPRYIIGK